MLITVCALVCGGIGAIVGAAVSTTEKGKEIDEKLNDALDVFEDKVSKYLPGKEKIKDLIEGGN